MPSYAVHNICGEELLKYLNLSSQETKAFIIGNILPDVSRIKEFNNLTDKEKRKAIQAKKKISHFRTNKNYIIEYPDCDEFISKYEKEVKINAATLAYFFHLYTDYYYYKYLIPQVVTFLDINMKETDDKKIGKYAKINKTGKIIDGKEFFNKDSEIGIYKEYSRCNKYFIDKITKEINCDELIDYIDEYGFLTNIEETNSMYAYYAVFKLKKYLKDTETETGELLYFTKEQLDNLVHDVVNTFRIKYGYLLDNYIIK